MVAWFFRGRVNITENLKMFPGIRLDGAAEDADPRLSGEMTAVSPNWFTEILDLVSVGICLFDQWERMVPCNRRHRDCYAPVSDML